MQVPVTYHIEGTSPVRCGGVTKAPYTIINLSVENTCWLSQNAGMQVGQGIPLYPGTSTQWQYDGDFYAIADGPAAGGLDVIATNDVVDWDPNPIAIATAILNSGVLIIDSPISIFSGVVPSSGSNPDWFDVSRFQSILVNMTCTALNAIGNCIGLLQFSNDAISINRSYQIEWCAISGPDNNDTWRASVPILGKYCRFVLYGGGGITGTLVASNRPSYTINQGVDIGTLTAAGPMAFYWDTAFTLNNGASLVIQLPPWFGNIDIDISFVTAAGNGLVFVDRHDVNTAVFGTIRSYQSAPFFAGSNLHAVNSRIAVFGEALRVSLINLSGVNFTSCTVRIVPVSGYGPID